MASNWTHLICDKCWKYIHGNQFPLRLNIVNHAPCCYCGVPTESAIYVREDPLSLRLVKNTLMIHTHDEI